MDSYIFPRALAQNETQLALSRIWTPVSDSISSDDNYYAKQGCKNLKDYEDQDYINKLIF